LGQEVGLGEGLTFVLLDEPLHCLKVPKVELDRLATQRSQLLLMGLLPKHGKDLELVFQILVVDIVNLGEQFSSTAVSDKPLSKAGPLTCNRTHQSVGVEAWRSGPLPQCESCV
jgi:hypothetical protein